MQNKCINCGQYRNCKDSVASWIFFIIGLIAAFSMRLVAILIHVNPGYSKGAWYVGVIGFSVFFIHKYRISQARARIIEKEFLAERLKNNEKLNDRDYKFIGEILCSLMSRKERINYFFIFSLSAITVILAIYMDFIK